MYACMYVLEDFRPSLQRPTYLPTYLSMEWGGGVDRGDWYAKDWHGLVWEEGHPEGEGETGIRKRAAVRFIALFIGIESKRTRTPLPLPLPRSRAVDMRSVWADGSQLATH